MIEANLQIILEMNISPFKKFYSRHCLVFCVLVLICFPRRYPDRESWLMADNIYFDKWVHAGMFAMLAFLFMLPLVRINLSTRRPNGNISFESLLQYVSGD